MRAFKTMLKVEAKLAIRSVDSIFFGIIFPMVVVLLIGMIYGNKLAFKGSRYTMLQASFAGVIVIGICATGLMGLPIVLSDYRNKKILKWFSVTPISPMKIIFVQMIICFIIAVISALGVFLVSSLAFGYKMRGSELRFVLAFCLVTISIYSIGGLIASLSPNIKIANLVCNVFYFPMLILSGATIPYEILPSSVKLVSNALPLTQGIKLLKATSLGQPLNNVTFSILFMIIISILCIIISIKTFRWE
ncbi:ABC transporter permease [Clostridium hydrogenum]|uniref:ABC transporter permease n=1 Tax=Clostridium hydrogenum TaxID=2855764 RepID=UPI001F25CFAE|nr:ABC transporter permease [Clostridium hydrogenum]